MAVAARQRFANTAGTGADQTWAGTRYRAPAHVAGPYSWHRLHLFCHFIGAERVLLARLRALVFRVGISRWKDPCRGCRAAGELSVHHP